jgi:hypothetical protein
MQLKNRILKELSSDITTLDKVKENIIKELNRLEASNISSENNKISFKNRFWKFGSRSSLMSSLNSGCFEIVQQDKKIVVTFTGYYSMMIELIILLVFTSLVVFVDPYFGVGCLFIIIGFGSKYVTVSEGCKEIISKI